MKRFKHFFCALLAVALVFSLVPISVSASDWEERVWTEEELAALPQVYIFQVTGVVDATDEWFADRTNWMEAVFTPLWEVVISVSRDGVEVATITTDDWGEASYLLTTDGTYSATVVEAYGFDITLAEFERDPFTEVVEVDGEYFLGNFFFVILLEYHLLPRVPVVEVPAPPVCESQDIRILLDGVVVESDVPPIIIDNRTMVPLRAISEALGAEVGWDGATWTVTISIGNTRAILVINYYNVVVVTNGQENIIVLEVAPTIVNSRTLVPVRFITELFGIDVDWNVNTRTVTITS